MESRNLGPADAAALVRHQLLALWQDTSTAGALAPLMLWGPPGVGKSWIVRDVAADLGVALVDVRLSQREPVDMRGLPVPNGDRVSWLVSEEWPRDRDSRGIIFFDELTAADRSLQAAAYEFILDRRLGALYRVPDGWLIVAAGNRAEDRAVTTPMSSALANRFCHLSVGVRSDQWLDWAEANGIHPSVIAFLRWRPNLLFSMDGDLQRGWPSPRSWARVSTQLWSLMGEGLRIPDDLIHAMVVGLVGPAAGHEFMAFRSRHFASDPRALLRGDEPLHLPEDPDQMLVLCRGLVEALAARRFGTQAWNRFVSLGRQFPSDFATMMMTDALRRATPEQAADLAGDPAVAEWIARHGSAALLDGDETQPGPLCIQSPTHQEGQTVV